MIRFSSFPRSLLSLNNDNFNFTRKISEFVIGKKSWKNRFCISELLAILNWREKFAKNCHRKIFVKNDGWLFISKVIWREKFVKIGIEKYLWKHDGWLLSSKFDEKNLQKLSSKIFHGNTTFVLTIYKLIWREKLQKLWKWKYSWKHDGWLFTS